MHRIAKGLCTAGLIVLPAVATATVAPLPTPTAAEQDAGEILHYLLGLMNGRATMREAFATATPHRGMSPLLQTAMGRFDLRELSAMTAPLITRHVDVETLQTCAQFVRAPEQIALLDAVPESTDPMAAIASMPEAQQLQLIEVLAEPCMQKVHAVLAMPEASAVPPAYFNRLFCASWAALPAHLRFNLDDSNLTCPHAMADAP